MDPTPEPAEPAIDSADEQPAILVNRPGFGIQDLPNPGVAASIRRAIALLPAGQSRLLLAAAAIQASLGLLDLLGIALVGLLAAIAAVTVLVGKTACLDSGAPTTASDSEADLIVVGSVSRNLALAHELLTEHSPARTIWIHGEDTPPLIDDARTFRESGAYVLVRSIGSR